MQIEAEPRFKKRVPCDLIVAGARHPGIVLNLSRSGLYVQTSVTFHRGDWVTVDLNSEIATDAIGLDAVVMWNKKVAAQLRGVRHGGIGLQIRNAGRAYYDLLSEVAGESGTTVRVDAKAAEPVEVHTEPVYRVRVRLREMPRSKTLWVSAGSEGEARSKAIARAGEGTWEILEVLRLGGPNKGH